MGGTIPSELAGLTQLQSLYVSLFALRAPTRASLLPPCADRYLADARRGGCVRRDLDTNSLSGTIPSELAGLAQLQHLYVSLFALRAPKRASLLLLR